MTQRMAQMMQLINFQFQRREVLFKFKRRMRMVTFHWDFQRKSRSPRTLLSSDSHFKTSNTLLDFLLESTSFSAQKLMERRFAESTLQLAWLPKEVMSIFCSKFIMRMFIQDSQTVDWWANTLTKWRLVTTCLWKDQKVDCIMKDMEISISQKNQSLERKRSDVLLEEQASLHAIRWSKQV